MEQKVIYLNACRRQYTTEVKVQKQLNKLEEDVPALDKQVADLIESYKASGEVVKELRAHYVRHLIYKVRNILEKL